MNVEAMIDLISKVEAEAAERRDFRNCFGSPCQDMEYVQRTNDAFYAYRGSLDAAESLHNSTVPTWAVETLGIWPAGLSYIELRGTREEDGDVWHHPDYGRAAAHNKNPARAWLLAILKALIAQEGTP